MAVLTRFKLAGDPDELLRIKQEKLDPHIDERAPELGGLAHVVVRADDGIWIYNLWKDETGNHELAQEIAPLARDAGLPMPTEREQLEVVQYELPGASD